MPKLNISKKAVKFLEKIPSKHAKQIAYKLQELKKDIHPNDSKSLKGSKYFRVDSGEYRIVYRYTPEEDTTYISLIGKRNDDEIYKQLDRLTH